MTGPLIDPELLEHCAQAAYEADRAPGREWARDPACPARHNSRCSATVSAPPQAVAALHHMLDGAS